MRLNHLSTRLAVCASFVLPLAACSEDKASGATPADDAAVTMGTDASADDASVEVVCPKTAWKPGMTTVTIKDADVDRSYMVYVPADLDTSKPSPLVLNYHGLTSSASEQVAFSGLNATADKNGFIVVYPEGINKSFNAGSCCGALASPPNTADDGALARNIVKDVEANICVDKRRVYSTGMSNGGYMSEYNACVNADIFAAVAPVSAMGMKQPECTPSRPIPMIAFNGTADTLVNYDGATSSVNDWLARNGCTGEPTREDYGTSYCETWSKCDADVSMIYCTVTEQGHCWPGTSFCPFGMANVEINANDEMWKFFEQYTLPE